LPVSRAQYAITEQDLKRTKELVESGVSSLEEIYLTLEATAAGQEQQWSQYMKSLVLISRIKPWLNFCK